MYGNSEASEGEVLENSEGGRTTLQKFAINPKNEKDTRASSKKTSCY
ncbi:MAG: hypothetical protein CM1200mP33_6310 [Chloroflexota bacterium]|nr:MAG: hypothetical protein CM1200mP33_6310 [Chloroflexota bacterium]